MEKCDRKRYIMVDKSGKEIFHSDSFCRFIGTAILTTFFALLAIALIGAVISGILNILS